MAFRIDLSNPWTKRYLDFSGGEGPDLGSFAQTGPGAEAQAQLESRLGEVESLATAFDFGAGVFDRLTAAVGSGDAAGWAGRGLAEAQQDFARLPPLAQEQARTLNPAMKQGSLGLILRGYEARSGAVTAAWQRQLDSLRTYVEAVGAAAPLRPALARGLEALTGLGFLDPADPAPRQAVEDAIASGEVRHLAKTDRAAALALLQTRAVSADTGARLRDEIAAAERRAQQARQAGFNAALREQHSAMATTGVLGDELPREDFYATYGREEGERRYQSYRGARDRAPLRQAIRGRTPAEIAALRVDAANPEAFDSIAAADAAERAQDPAAYALAYDPALAGLPAEAAPDLWAAQARVGIAEAQRRPWTLKQQDELARQWLALPPSARAGWLQATLGPLPAEQRGGALSQLEAAGLDGGSPGALRKAWGDLEGHNVVNANTRLVAIAAGDGAHEDRNRGGQLDDGPPTTDGAPNASIDPTSVLTLSGHRPNSTHERWGDSWQARGLPNLNSAGGWASSAYTPDGAASLIALADRVLASEFSPDQLPAIEKMIEERFSGDPAAIHYWISRARTLIDPSPTASRLAGGAWDRTTAREDFEELRYRIETGQPYSEAWANSRESLAALEKESGYRLRPVGEGQVGFFDNNDEIFLTLPLRSIEGLSDDLDGTIKDLLTVHKIFSNETTPEDINDYSESLVRNTLERVDRAGNETFEEDRSRSDAVYLAYRAFLKNPDDAESIAFDLFQVLQSTRHSDRDFAFDAIETALDFVPLGDLISAGIDAAALLEALENGDSAAAIASGLSAAINLIGSVPGVGDLAEKALRSAADAFGAIKSPFTVSMERLAEAAGIAGAKASAILNAIPVKNSRGFVEEERISDIKLKHPELSDEEIVRIELQSAIYRKNMTLRLKKIFGEKIWKNIPDKNKFIGDVAREVGALAEDFLKPSVKSKYKNMGYDLLEGEQDMLYNDIRFRVDFVGIKFDAREVEKIGNDTILVSGKRYNVKDVYMIDSKFGSAEFSIPQVRASLEIEKNGFRGIDQWTVMLSDVNPNDIVNILNNSEIIKREKIIVTEEMVINASISIKKSLDKKLRYIPVRDGVAMIMAIILTDSMISLAAGNEEKDG